MKTKLSLSLIAILSFSNFALAEGSEKETKSTKSTESGNSTLSLLEQMFTSPKYHCIDYPFCDDTNEDEDQYAEREVGMETYQKSKQSTKSKPKKKN